MARIAMLGTGLIGGFYTEALHGQRARDRVTVAYGRDPERTKAFAARRGASRARPPTWRRRSATRRWRWW